jgi:pilus assembly protein CpaE
MPARVLVITPQPEVQQQFGNMLRRDGYEILVASDGADGYRRWGADRPDLIVLDADLPDVNGLQLVTHLRQNEAPGFHTPIVVCGLTNDIDAKVQSLRAGADDYMTKPIHPQELSARVRGLLARFARAPIQAPQVKRTGRVHAYYGAKGGVGTTTLAINTAIALHKGLGRSVVLVDGNLQFGDHRVFLDMKPDTRSIIDAIGATAIDADVLRRVIVRHDSGIDLLLGPAMPEAAELVSAEQHHMLRAVQTLKQMYDYVIVDLDKHLDDHQLDIVGMADRLVVVMTADLSCLKNVRLVLETMSSLGLPDERLVLVLNRSNAFTGISTKSVENVLNRPIAQQIGNDYRSAITALNSGTPFMANKADSALGRGVMELARLVDQDTTGIVEEAARFELVPARA